MPSLKISRFLKHVTLDRQAPELPTAFSRAVERAVDQGLFDEGAALPSATDLASAYGVSPATIRNGLAELVARNVLVSRRGPGGGYWIAKRDANLQRLTDEFVERARKTGNDDIAIAESVRARFPRLLSCADQFRERADARRLFGTIRSEVDDLAEQHDRYLDDSSTQ